MSSDPTLIISQKMKGKYLKYQLKLQHKDTGNGIGDNSEELDNIVSLHYTIT